MNANDLLLWLSANGAGTWARYRVAVDELAELIGGADDDAEGTDEESRDDIFPVYQRLRLNLERLGHAEFFRPEFPNGWRIVPPTLICSNRSGRVSGILCGARTDSLIELIERAAGKLEVVKTAQGECPDCIEIMADSQSELEELARAVGMIIQPDGCRTLLAAVPPVDDPQLRFPDELPFGTDWTVNRFSPKTLGWIEATADEARSTRFGLFRFQVRFQPRYYLKMKGRSYLVAGQVAKYILLKARRRRVVSYDDAKKDVSVPLSCRPPLLIDRALTLCSGIIPSIVNGCLRYSQVSDDIALATVGLLRQ